MKVSRANHHLPAPLLLPTLLCAALWFITPEGILRTVFLLGAVICGLVMLQQWLAHQRWFDTLGVLGQRISISRVSFSRFRPPGVRIPAAVAKRAQAAWLVVGVLACLAAVVAFVAIATQHPVTRYTYNTTALNGAPDLAEYRGFYVPERDPVNGPYTWTQNRATLVLDFLVHRPITLTVEMRSAAQGGGPDAPVEVDANGVKVGELRPDPTNAMFTAQQLRFVPPDWGGTQTEIKLIPAPFQPKGGDNRTLGTMVQQITIDRSEAWNSILRWRWLLWLLPLCAVIAAACWFIGQRSDRQNIWASAGAIVACIAGSACAAALLVVYVRVGVVDSNTYRIGLIGTAYFTLLFAIAAASLAVTHLGVLRSIAPRIVTSARAVLVPRRNALPRTETRRMIVRDLALLFVVALAIRVIWAVLVPPWLAPDEPEHYLYVSHIAEQARLPLKADPNAPAYPPEFYQSAAVFLSQKLSTGFSAEDRALPYYPVSLDYHRLQTYELPHADRLTSIGGPRAAQYPPLYYLIEAIPYRLAENTPILTRIFVVRCGTAVLGALSCLFGYLLAYEVKRQRRWGYALGLSMALIPMYVFNTTTVNNDAMLNLATTAFLWLLIRAWLRGLSRPLALGIGLASGLVLLSKPTASLLIVVGAGIVLMKAWGSRGAPESSTATGGVPPPRARVPLMQRFATTRQWLNVGVYALGAVVLYGPWLLVRWFVTGNFGLGFGTVTLPFIRWLIGTTRVAAASPGTPSLASTVTHSFGEYLLFKLRQGGEHDDWLFVRTFWGYFGWLDVPMDMSIYALIHVFLVIGLIGLALLLVMHRADRGVALLLLAFILTQAIFLFVGADYLLYFRTTGSELGIQGRYFFPVIAPILLLFLMGWDWLCRGRPIALRLAPFFMLFIQLAGLTTILTSYYGVKFG